MKQDNDTIDTCTSYKYTYCFVFLQSAYFAFFIFPLYTASSPGSTVGLNLRLPLYVGGVDPTITISPSAGASQGFVGCVGEVSIEHCDVYREIKCCLSLRHET